MYLFIAIIFIAELIIAGNIINGILRAARKIRALNSRVKELKPEIHNAIVQTRECVSCLQTGVNAAITFVKRKHQEVMRRITRTILIYLMLILIKNKYKKLATICQYAVLAKDYWDGLPA